MQVLIADELPDICIEILEKAGLIVLKTRDKSRGIKNHYQHLRWNHIA